MNHIENSDRGETLIDMATISQEDQFKACAECYCKIWREPPWNETFWTTDQVVTDIKEATSKRNFNGFLILRMDAEDQSETRCALGFTWGFDVDEKDLLTISGNESIARLANRDTFYIAELGVVKECRGEKLGEILSQSLIRKVFRKGTLQVILRTDEQAMPARNLYSKIGFVELPFHDGNHKTRTYWILDQ